MGPVGAQQIGSAQFTISVNNQQFGQQLNQAKQQAAIASAAIGKSFGPGSSAGMGLLYLGQTVDDLQYGFRAIVNNIPQVVMAMGGGAGLAGAVGVIAVVTNQVIQHWEELEGKLSNTQVWRTGTGAVLEFSDAMQKMGVTSETALNALAQAIPQLKPVIDLFKMLNTESASGKAAAATKAKIEALPENIKAISKIQGEDQSMRSKSFKEAIEAYGGGGKLIKDITEAQMKLTPGADKQQVQMRVVDMIKEGLEGNNVNTKFFGEKFGKAFDAILLNAASKGETERVMAAHRKETQELNEQGMEGEKEARKAFAKDKRERQEDLQQQIELAEGHRKHILQAAHDIKPSQIFQGTHAFASAMLQSGLDQTAKKQLKEAEKLNMKIDQLRKDLAKVNRMQFDN